MKQITPEIKARPVLFYVLRDPLSKEIRYVGKTEQTLKIRLRRHIDGGKSYIGNWVKSVVKKGLKPEIIKIGECLSTDDWRSIEKLLIAEYRNFGYRLCNVSEGGWGASGVKKSKKQIEALVDRMSVPVYSKDVHTNKVTKHKSYTQAAKDIGITQSAISIAIKTGGTRKGFLFSTNKAFKRSNLSKKYATPIACIYQDGTEVLFQSSNSAAKKLGLYADFIRKVANGKYKQYHGLKFEYR